MYFVFFDDFLFTWQWLCTLVGVLLCNLGVFLSSLTIYIYIYIYICIHIYVMCLQWICSFLRCELYFPHVYQLNPRVKRTSSNIQEIDLPVSINLPYLWLRLDILAISIGGHTGLVNLYHGGSNLEHLVRHEHWAPLHDHHELHCLSNNLLQLVIRGFP